MVLVDTSTNEMRKRQKMLSARLKKNRKVKRSTNIRNTKNSYRNFIYGHSFDK